MGGSRRYYEGYIVEPIVVAIDRELELSQNPKKASCTSHTTFDVVAPGTFGSVKKAHFVDSSCSVPSALDELSRERVHTIDIEK